MRAGGQLACGVAIKSDLVLWGGGELWVAGYNAVAALLLLIYVFFFLFFVIKARSLSV